MKMATSFRPPKQWVLQEKETITSFASWQSNILYHLSLNNEFAAFLDDAFEWQKKSSPNRGLASDSDEVPAGERKTAAQKNIHLERMLGLIAQFAPSLLRNDIIGKSTSLNWIWKRIRKHYSFQQSEVNFLRLSQIKREADERYETLFQRIIAHLEDNLLKAGCAIHHDFAAVTTNEEMTPTCERLAVYLWLNLIDPRLPEYISRVYSNHLQTQSLKDIQPQICDSMDSLLAEINNQEEISVNISRSSYNSNRNFGQRPNNRFQSSQAPRGLPRRNQSSQPQHKECFFCKAAGRAYSGHTIANCWHISKADRMLMVQALQVSIDDGDENRDEDNEEYSDQFARCTLTEPTTTAPSVVPETLSIRRVESSCSPYFYAYYQHHTVKVLIDTGATSTLISSSFVSRMGIQLRPTRHSARQLDKSKVPLAGEVKFSISFGKLLLSVEGLVNDSVECDILAGVPFCKANAVDISCYREEISIGAGQFSTPPLTPVVIRYGAAPQSIQHDIYRVESAVLRNDTSKVLLPGEYLEVAGPDLDRYEGEVSVEPRADSPLAGEWPSCSITRVIQGTVRIPNDTCEPIQLSKSMHIAQIRRVTTPPDIPYEVTQPPVPVKLNPVTEPFSSTIAIDPSGELLTEEERRQFSELHRTYDKQFSPDISVYNGHSGNVKAYIDMGPVPPPATKPKMPCYNQSTMKALQEEADRLEALGVLVKPEDIGVKVRHASPSFLVKKPEGEGFRLVTAFNQLGSYVRFPPSVSITCNDVLRRLASWKFIIKTYMKKAYYHIPMSKSSMQWLGTHTPFGGLRVYTRPVMGMPGSAEFLQELMARVFGEYIREGYVITIADDMHVGGNTISQLLNNWEIVLRCCQQNNLTLSAPKTIVCPKTTMVLGWVWHHGTITVSPHKLSPLTLVEPPRTCSSMRSFIGAYKALSRCIPNYSSLMSPLEGCIKGLLGSQQITWTDELRAHFHAAQVALRSPAVLTIPVPTDKLTLTVDASPVNDGIGCTLFVIRDGKRYIGELFSVKLKTHQIGWQPCEMEALAITSGVQHFAPYIRESLHPLQVLSDSKPCVQAFAKLCKGKFSASSRVSTFLSCLSDHNVVVTHLKGSGNMSSDFASRNPVKCCDSSCQICEFVAESCESVVRKVTVDEVLSGSACIPYFNKSAWKSAQQNCPALRKTHTYLLNGTRPSKKVKNILDVRRYLEVCVLNSSNGLLVVRKTDPYMHQRELIVVPENVLSGLVTALHLYFSHATSLQLKKVFQRYFYALNAQKSIQKVLDNCAECTALKCLPKEVFTQSSTASANAPGQLFAADIIKRTRQLIFTVRDVHTSFTVASFVQDETAPTLRTALLSTTSSLRTPSCQIKVDNAPGLASLKNDPVLSSHGVSLDFGRVKNVNKNPVAEKCNQELEKELLRIDPSGSPVTEIVLQDAAHSLNSRIRHNGLSARELLFCRDQITSQSLNIDDTSLSKTQQSIRASNLITSARSKANVPYPASVPEISVGSLVYLKKEGNKFKARESYMVMGIRDHLAILQKLNASGLFQSRKYEVPLEELILVRGTNQDQTCGDVSGIADIGDISSSSEDDEEASQQTVPVRDDVPTADVIDSAPTESTRPYRARREPAWLREDVWLRD